MPKQKSESQLKRKLWPLVSKYIRERDKYVCFTCGRKGEGSGIHAGHCIPRSICGPLLYHHPLNLAASCYRCNIHLFGNGAIFISKLERLHPGIMDYFEKLRKQKAMWDKKKLQALIQGFSDGLDYEENFYEVMQIPRP